jgi:hypothetical protein
VGTETSDDAAVYRINDSQAIVATTDVAETRRASAAQELARVWQEDAWSGGSDYYPLELVKLPGSVTFMAAQSAVRRIRTRSLGFIQWFQSGPDCSAVW